MEAASSDFFIRSLNKDVMVDLYLAFSDAFEGYPVPFSLTLEDFRYKFETYMQLDYALSAGAWAGERLAGFLMVRAWGSEVYIGATGVRRAWQGKGVVRRLLTRQTEAFRAGGAKSLRLEVLEKNERALRLYRENGFETSRTLSSYRGTPVIMTAAPVRGILTASARLPWDEVRKWMTHEPPFMCSEAVVNPGHTRDRTWLYRENDQLMGLLVMNPDNGRVAQLLVHPDARGRGIGKYLLSYAVRMSPGPLAFINVPEEAVEMNSLLRSAGLQDFARQLEMKKNL